MFLENLIRGGNMPSCDVMSNHKIDVDKIIDKSPPDVIDVANFKIPFNFFSNIGINFICFINDMKAILDHYLRLNAKSNKNTNQNIIKRVYVKVIEYYNTIIPSERKFWSLVIQINFIKNGGDEDGKV